MKTEHEAKLLKVTKNIILTYLKVSDFSASIRFTLTLHKYFGSLNSDMAICFQLSMGKAPS